MISSVSPVHDYCSCLPGLLNVLWTGACQRPPCRLNRPFRVSTPMPALLAARLAKSLALQSIRVPKWISLPVASRSLRFRLLATGTLRATLAALLARGSSPGIYRASALKLVRRMPGAARCTGSA